MDLKETFDRALDGGPAHRPIEDRLAVGRRATRRRRTAMGASVLATALVLGGIGWAAQPDPAVKTEGSVATSPTPPPTVVSESPAPSMPTPMYEYDFYTGDLETASGVAIQHQVDSPIARSGVKSSAAVITFKGKTWWVMSALREAGRPLRNGWNEEQEPTPGRSFEQWMHEMDVLWTEPMFDTYGYKAGWVTISENGLLTPHKGATILEQSSPARLDQAPEGVPSATATIEVDGARLCVIARIMDDPSPGIVYLAESEYPGCGDALIGYPYESAP
ncbi:MAG: hypothetical protein ABIR39_23935 [Nocardioides sp.]|uniref:hypothetical protein n=1 Tax=Nocardioides sp. TaxID=35761 RepID=UPI0032655A35